MPETTQEGGAAIDKALRPCRFCGAAWQRTEILGAAWEGGGYRLRCHDCLHEWDDINASHGVRDTQRIKDGRLTALDLLVTTSCEAIYSECKGYWPSDFERHCIAIALLAHAPASPRGTDHG